MLRLLSFRLGGRDRVLFGEGSGRKGGGGRSRKKAEQEGRKEAEKAGSDRETQRFKCVWREERSRSQDCNTSTRSCWLFAQARLLQKPV